MLKLKILLGVSVITIMGLGIILASYQGQIKGHEEIRNLYLSVACSNLPEFRSALENYNTDHLSIELTAEEKQRWVEKHLSGCNADHNEGCRLMKDGKALLCPSSITRK